ncbi:hypothetical protein JCM24511_08496, partial [Saitozyma sp. JCM 24511]
SHPHHAPIHPSEIPAAAKGKTVFLTGATGYIGGTVLSKLLSLPVPPALFTVLVRDPKKAELFSSLTVPPGTTIQPLQGSLSDYDKLEKAAAEHDITVSCADADNLEAVQAILKGMKKRREQSGHRPYLIHTSGTGVLVDNAKGNYPNDKIYTDLNPMPASRDDPALLSMEVLPENAPHRKVDLAILEADAQGWCKSYIVLPSTIWGVGKGEIFEKGIANSFSDQVPTMARAGLDREQAGHVGKGANIWPHVNVSDVGDLYALVYNGALRKDIGHGKSGYYFGASGEYTMLAVSSAIGATLLDHKWSQTALPAPWTEDDLKKYYGGSTYMGTNSRCRADRSKSIGWKPKFDDFEDFLKHVSNEVVRVEKHFGRKMDTATTKSAY